MKYEKYLRKLGKLRASDVYELFDTDTLNQYGWHNYGNGLKTVENYDGREVVVYSLRINSTVEYWGNGIWKVY